MHMTYAGVLLVVKRVGSCLHMVTRNRTIPLQPWCHLSSSARQNCRRLKWTILISYIILKMQNTILLLIACVRTCFVSITNFQYTVKHSSKRLMHDAFLCLQAHNSIIIVALVRACVYAVLGRGLPLSCLEEGIVLQCTTGRIYRYRCISTYKITDHQVHVKRSSWRISCVNPPVCNWCVHMQTLGALTFAPLYLAVQWQWWLWRQHTKERFNHQQAPKLVYAIHFLHAEIARVHQYVSALNLWECPQYVCLIECMPISVWALMHEFILVYVVH